MLRIITHIERSLLVHDCVIVPGLGGFVLQTVSAVYDAKEHLFSPLRKEIVFNETLQHNDGLLIESYMQQYEADYRKAQLMLEEDVVDLKNDLRENRKLTLGMLGTFRIGHEGQFVFYPEESKLFSIDSYGLESFHFPKLQPHEEIAASVSTKKKDTLYIPINRTFIRTVAASAAAVALFFLVSTPINEVNQSAYTASFIPTEMVINPIADVKVTEMPVAEEITTPPAPKVEVKRAKSVATPSSKMYHIVIGSFPNEKQANGFLSKVDRTECASANIVVRNGKYRVYANKFDNREAAENYLSTLRTNPKYKDAWLFISR